MNGQGEVVFKLPQAGGINFGIYLDKRLYDIWLQIFDNLANDDWKWLALQWDVMGGVARRAWARNENAIETATEWNKNQSRKGHITLPYIPKKGLVEKLVKEKLNK